VLLGDAAHSALPHQGAGGGQALEDAYILALSLRDYFKDKSSSDDDVLLEKQMQFYQKLRLPRAQAVQNQTRETSRIYELQTPEFRGKSFEECLPVFAQTMKGRMDWIWHEEVDTGYERAKAEGFN
jgi:salicylate hydroxylase